MTEEWRLISHQTTMLNKLKCLINPKISMNTPLNVYTLKEKEKRWVIWLEEGKHEE